MSVCYLRCVCILHTHGECVSLTHSYLNVFVVSSFRPSLLLFCRIWLLLQSFLTEIVDARIISKIVSVIDSEKNQTNPTSSFNNKTLNIVFHLVPHFMALGHKLTGQKNRSMYQITIFYLSAQWFAMTCWTKPTLTTCILDSFPSPLKSFLLHLLTLVFALCHVFMCAV